MPAECGCVAQPKSGGNAEYIRPEQSMTVTARWIVGAFVIGNILAKNIKEEWIVNLKLLKLLSKNARYKTEELAAMTGQTNAEIDQEIARMEKEGLIRGYKTVVDWERMDSAYVSAIIELKVTPKAGLGFEEVARRVMKYPEVETVYLMSGGYDLSVVVKGKTFQEVALFVAKELSTIDSVLSTSTHFVLRRYKELDVEMVETNGDDRGTFSL